MAQSTPFAKQAARFSFWVPFACIAINILSSAATRDSRVGKIAVGIVVLSLITAGFVLAIIALVQMRKHGRRRILVYALIGLVLNGLILASVPMTFGAARRAKKAALQNQVDIDAAMDAALNHPGWFSNVPMDGAVISILSIDDDTEMSRIANEGAASPSSLVIVEIDNTDGSRPLTLERSQIAAVYADGSVIVSLDTATVVKGYQNSTQQRVVQASAPVTVQPGQRAFDNLYFFPQGTDFTDVTSFAFVINGEELELAGSYRDVAEKQAIFEQATQTQ